LHDNVSMSAHNSFRVPFYLLILCMANKSHNSKTSRKTESFLDESVGNYSKHPFFVKKANRAKAFLKSAGLPKELVKKSS